MTADDVASLVRDARARGASLRITGGGSWMNAGAPCAATEPLPLGTLAGIVAYEPGDLTLTARAGTTLRDIARATAAEDQWLPLDPAAAAEATVGATVATASYGPLATAFGTPRNQVLGCEVVTGTGDIVRAGGRVVKNVAGFDVTRLMVGAWGTLGALTEVTVRLRARPEADVTLAVALGDLPSVARAQRWLRTTEFSPLAAELLSPALATRLGLRAENASVLLLRLGGNEAVVSAGRHAASALGDHLPVETTVWQTLASVEWARAHAATVRLSTAPAGLASLWHACRAAIGASGGLAHATVSRGVVRCLLPHDDDASAARLPALLAALPHATVIAECLPHGLWASRAVDPVIAELSRGVRTVFDPGALLNPGIMGSA